MPQAPGSGSGSGGTARGNLPIRRSRHSGRHSRGPACAAAACAVDLEPGIAGLGDVEAARVMAEIVVAQLGMAVEAEALDDEPVEMPDHVVGQVERAGFRFRQVASKACLAGIEGVAMRPVDPLRALFFQDPVEQPAGAAVGVGHQDPAVGSLRYSRIFSRTRSGIRCGALWSHAGTQATSKAGTAFMFLKWTISRARAPQAITMVPALLRPARDRLAVRRYIQGLARIGAGRQHGVGRTRRESGGVRSCRFVRSGDAPAQPP